MKGLTLDRIRALYWNRVPESLRDKIHRAGVLIWMAGEVARGSIDPDDITMIGSKLPEKGLALDRIRALYRLRTPASLRKKVYRARVLAWTAGEVARGKIDLDDLTTIGRKLPEIDRKLPEIDRKLPEIDRKLPEIDRKLPGHAKPSRRIDFTRASVVERYMEFARACDRCSNALAADVYIAHGVEAMPGAWHVNLRHPGRLICDVIEIPSFNARAVRSRWDETTTAFLDRSFEGFLRDADALLTVGWELGRHLAKYGATVSVIPNYRNAETLVRSDIIRQRCGISAVDHLVLAMSGIASGFEDVLAAILKLKGNVHLACVGRLVPDSYDASMRALVDSLRLSERVHFFEPVPYADLASFASGADVGLLVRDPAILNNYVSLPNRLFDYAASGLPVVTPGIPDIARLVTEHDFGIVLDAISPDSWGNGIMRCIERRTEMSANALGASALLTWDTIEQSLRESLGNPARVTFFGVGDLTKNNRTVRMSRSLIANGAFVTICTERSTLENPPPGLTIHVL